MPTAATGFARSAAPERARWTHRILHALMRALDRFVHGRGGELPPEWFKHPPI